jgi:putative tryptophan/tyrosine transport system substrate-binding protein
VELQPIDARDVGEFERVLADFAGAPNGGLIVPLSTSSETHRTRIIALADRHRLPAVYPSRLFVTSGGLTAYGPDTIDLYRRAVGYVDRILKGEKPADLPVQAPTKYETIINLKTATIVDPIAVLQIHSCAPEIASDAPCQQNPFLQTE